MLCIASYNVLSASLCTRKNYPTYDPEVLETSIRTKSILSKFDDLVISYDIIHLQEVDKTLRYTIQDYFEQKNWKVYSNVSNGNRFNGFMVEFTVVNTANVSVQSVESVLVSEQCKRYPKDIIPSWYDTIKVYLKDTYKYYSGQNSTRKHPPLWKAMKMKNNSMLILKVCIGDKKYVIGNYHMPYHSGSDEASAQMTGFVNLAAATLKSYAAGLPYVLAGNFNITPDSSAYQYVTTGDITNPKHDLHKISNGKWEYTPKCLLKSAYWDKNVVEPIFTNHSNANRAGPFTDTLDYIWMSRSLKCVDVLQLPDEAPEGFLPNDNEPSDHLAIGAHIIVT